jgi:hypothetical protein
VSRAEILDSHPPDHLGGVAHRVSVALKLPNLLDDLGIRTLRSITAVILWPKKVRAATKLKLQGIGDPDQESVALLDRNIAEAEQAYRYAGDFETTARALSGWREALRQRLEVVRAPGRIEVPVTVTNGGTLLPMPGSKPGTWKMAPEEYWAGMPAPFRNADRYAVQRTLRLQWGGDDEAAEDIKVREVSTDALVWRKDGR